jgi:hypothetical protein
VEEGGGDTAYGRQDRVLLAGDRNLGTGEGIEPSF